MSKKFRFELNSKGVSQLLKSDSMKTAISQLSNSIAQRAGDGYTSKVRYHKRRIASYIYPNNKKSEKDNSKNNTLLKVLK